MRSYLPTVGAVIMAGGSGKRMRPLTDLVPKPLLKIGNHTTLDYLLGSLESHGILRKNIVVVAKYLADQIYSHLSSTGIRVCTGRHNEIVLNLLDVLPYVPEHFIATGCDLYSLDLLREATDTHLESHGSATLVICKVPDPIPRRKSWLYTIEGAFLKELDKGDHFTDIERDVLILRRDAVEQVAERMRRIVHHQCEGFEKYEKYSTSWNLVLKLLIEQGLKIRVLEKDTCRCHRINLPEDLAIAESMVAALGLMALSRDQEPG